MKRGIKEYAHSLHPDPHKVKVSLTQEGLNYADELRGSGTLGAILTYLSQYAPKSIAQIAEGTDPKLEIRVVRRNLRAFPEYFVERE